MSNAKKTKPDVVLKGEDFRPEPNPEGRPTIYTDAIAMELFERLSAGESLRAICKDDHMPCSRTIYGWMHKDDEFLRRYEAAKEKGCDAIADQLFEIADGDDPGRPDEDVQRSRLRVDTRKWYLSKIKTKRYGDKVEQTVVNKYEDMTDEEIDAEIERLQNQKD